MCPDFSYEFWKQRKAEGLKANPIIRACAIKENTKVLDLTAGWGRDAALMAVFGAQVTMVERHLMMFKLLEDALQNQDDLSKKMLNMALIYDDACHILKSHNMNFDVIYFDPMHPERDKSALVKKDLQILQHMVGRDEDKEQVLHLALNYPCKKVVVKWPSAKPPLKKPNHSIIGKTIRYDVFIL